MDHLLVDRRHCTNVCDVRHIRGAKTESHHFSEGHNYIENWEQWVH